jgi:hypothetical protein
MTSDNHTENRLREIEARILKLEQSEQRRAEAGLELLHKLAATEPRANLPEPRGLQASMEKTRKALAKLERKAKFRKPRKAT